MFERFTSAAREVVVRARTEAGQAHVRYIGTEHLLMALLDPGAAPAYQVLRDADVTLEYVRAQTARLAGPPSGTLGDEDAQALRTIGIDLDAVVASVEQSFGPGALSDQEPEKRRGLLGRRVVFTKRAKKVLELSLREALHVGDRHIGAEHLLLGMIRDGDGTAAKILIAKGVSLADLRANLLAGLGKAA